MNNTQPNDTLQQLVEMHGLVAVLEALSNIMAGRGSVCGGIVYEAAAIEGWLQSQGKQP